jgi:LacI family transcriptional regulator
VAVVGVENDESLCEMATPPLSSVAIDGEAVGYRAAQLLHQLMRGAQPPREPIYVAPSGIKVRQSSDVVAVDDPLLSLALRFIRDHACRGIKVACVLQAVPISRSALERGMRRALGRSPNAEIQRVKLTRARELLLETDLTLERVAQLSGFPHPQYLSALFKRHFAQTPGDFRHVGRV